MISVRFASLRLQFRKEDGPAVAAAVFLDKTVYGQSKNKK